MKAHGEVLNGVFIVKSFGERQDQTKDIMVDINQFKSNDALTHQCF